MGFERFFTQIVGRLGDASRQHESKPQRAIRPLAALRARSDVPITGLWERHVWVHMPGDVLPTIHRTFASQITLMPVPARYSNVGS